MVPTIGENASPKREGAAGPAASVDSISHNARSNAY